MIFTADQALFEIVWLSLRVSGIALLISTVIGIPIGAALGLARFLGRRLVVTLLYTGMGFPPVVVGLFVYLLLSRSGPLGSINSPLIPSLFTPGAMIAAQTIIAVPLVAGFTMASVLGVDPQLRDQVRSLGATAWQTSVAVLTEARRRRHRRGDRRVRRDHLGGGRGDAGGRQHRGPHRVLTTAIVLNTRQGEFDLALALGIILLGITFVINAGMLRLQGRSLDR